MEESCLSGIKGNILRAARKNYELNQAAVSKFEHQSDLYISTLRKILYAIGAELKIVAQFPDADVVINQFTDL